MKASQLRLLVVQTTDSGEDEWVEIPSTPAKRGFLTLAALCILLLGVLVGRPVRQNPQPEYVRVTVMPGDTLWALANRYGSPHQYPLKLVDDICQANELRGATLTPGQQLWIPIQDPESVRWQGETAQALPASR